MKKKQLVIIAGAAGEIGTAYAQHFSDNGVEVVAVVRTKRLPFSSPLVEEVMCHLENETDIARAFENVPLESYERVTFLHTIGVDKFDPRGYPAIRPMDTIDEDVYKTNVNSFKYLMRYLVKRLRTHNETMVEKIQLKLAMIGGVADKYAPFVIESFCEAKFILRQYIQSQVSLHPEWISGLSINVSSTITKSALAVRPYAETTYWLQPREVVEQSVSALLAHSDGYHEVDLIKKLPNFVRGYYENNAMLYEKWSKETGIK